MNPRTITALLLLLAAACALAKDKSKDLVTLQGSIVDSQCAFNVHSETRSHEWMIKSNVQNAGDEKSCTLHCVKDMGGSYVLVVKKEVYRLDNQAKIEPFAGKDVKVSGTLDAKTHTMHILEIAESK
jgi:hypothetical protein